MSSLQGSGFWGLSLCTLEPRARDRQCASMRRPGWRTRLQVVCGLREGRVSDFMGSAYPKC